MRKYKYKYKAFTFTVGVTSEIDIRKLRSGKLDIEDRGGTDVGEALKEILKNHTEPDVFIVLTIYMMMCQRHRILQISR